MISAENIYSKETVNSGRMFNGEYIIVENNKDVSKLEEYEKKLGFANEETKPTLIDVDCYVEGNDLQFVVHTHVGEGNTYKRLKAFLTKDEYFHLISDLTLENTEY